MRIHKFSDMIGGWFVGAFSPTAFETTACEVSYKTHPKGERWPKHFHAIATEINYLISGSMSIGEQSLVSGDIFVLEPNEIAEPVFIEDCKLICVKVPGAPNDKHIVD